MSRLSLYFPLSREGNAENGKNLNFHLLAYHHSCIQHRSFFISPSIMSHLTPELKHDIPKQYLPSSHDNSFGALARHYNIKGGKGTIQRWYARWDGTPAS